MPAIRQQITSRWNDQVGDCRQELVLIGIGIDEVAIYDSLQSCLLTDEEMALGPHGWNQFPDPFPKWNRTIDDALNSLASN